MTADFNDITAANEHRGDNFYSNLANSLMNMMDRCHMTNMATSGGVFTWQRTCRGHIRVAKKLNRSIADVNWRHQFLDAFVEVMQISL